MEPAKTNYTSVTVVAVLGIIIGAAGGYYFGYDKGREKAVAQVEAESTGEAVNPYADVETNPLEGVKTNPYQDVKTNPFE